VTDLIIKWPGRVDSSYASSDIDSEELTIPMPLSGIDSVELTVPMPLVASIV